MFYDGKLSCSDIVHNWCERTRLREALVPGYCDSHALGMQEPFRGAQICSASCTASTAISPVHETGQRASRFPRQPGLVSVVVDPRVASSVRAPGEGVPFSCISLLRVLKARWKCLLRAATPRS
eukprot:2910322-Rhodomonas_salina.1